MKIFTRSSIHKDTSTLEYKIVYILIFFFYLWQIAIVLWFFFHADIEAQIADIQSKKKEVQKSSTEGVSLLDSGNFYDTDFYDEGAKAKSRYDGYHTSIAANEEADEDEDEGIPVPQKRTTYTAPKSVMNDVTQVSWMF